MDGDPRHTSSGDDPPARPRVGADRAGRASRPIGWFVRAKLLLQRFWQPTGACLTCMPGGLLLNAASRVHWEIALKTGVATGALVLLLSFTRAARLFGHRWGNAAIVGVLTALGDAYSHESHYGSFHAETLLTGAVSAALALVGGWLFEDRARRVRAAWRGVIRRDR